MNLTGLNIISLESSSPYNDGICPKPANKEYHYTVCITNTASYTNDFGKDSSPYNVTISPKTFLTAIAKDVRWCKYTYYSHAEGGVNSPYNDTLSPKGKGHDHSNALKASINGGLSKVNNQINFPYFNIVSP